MIRLLILCSFILACTESDKSDDNKSSLPTYSFKFTGTEYEMHDSQTFKWALINRNTDEKVDEGEFTGANGTFTIEVVNKLVQDDWYKLVFFVDFNENGSCDAPPTDHAWTIQTSQITADVTLEDSHVMTFDEVCQYFTETTDGAIATQTLNISGQLVLDPNISLDGVSGNAIAGAQVFAAGFTDQEAFTDESGSFSLKLEIPVNESLVAEKVNVLMWYTQRRDEDNTVWSVPWRRVGAAREIEVAENISLGDVELTYTKGLRIPVRSSDGDRALPMCWVQVNNLGSQAVGRYNSSSEVFEVSYLPPGDYSITFTCPDHKPVTRDYTVGAATGFEQFEDQEAVTVELN